MRAVRPQRSRTRRTAQRGKSSDWTLVGVGTGRMINHFPDTRTSVPVVSDRIYHIPHQCARLVADDSRGTSPAENLTLMTRCSISPAVVRRLESDLVLRTLAGTKAMIGINAGFARTFDVAIKANAPCDPVEFRSDIIRGHSTHIEKSSFVGTWYAKCERIHAEEVGGYVIRVCTYAATVYFRLR